MSSIITTSREFRAEVLRGDKAMLQQLSAAYRGIERSLKLQLNSLMREIAEAERQGKTINQDWLRRSFRYQQLIRQVKSEVKSFSNGANYFIQSKQRDAIGLGQLHASDLIQAALPEISFFRLPTGAIEEMVGVLEDGSPLAKVLDKLGSQAAGGIRDAFLSGLGSGHGAATIARGIRQAIDIPRWRALAIARTEVMRAYRQSTLQTYSENSDVLDGWIWTATLSTRTCPACWALHGQFFPLTKQFFPSHVNCRCTSIPSVKGSDFLMTPGAVAFGNLPTIQQQEILGPSRYEMYQQGTSLMDFVMLTRDRDWGGAYQVRPLWSMKKRKRAA